MEINLKRLSKTDLRRSFDEIKKKEARGGNLKGLSKKE